MKDSRENEFWEKNSENNDNTSYADDTLGENTEVTQLGKALQDDIDPDDDENEDYIDLEDDEDDIDLDEVDPDEIEDVDVEEIDDDDEDDDYVDDDMI